MQTVGKGALMVSVLFLAESCSLHDPGWRKEVWEPWIVDSVQISNGTASAKDDGREVIVAIPTCRFSIGAYFPDTQAVVTLSVRDDCGSELTLVEPFAPEKPPSKPVINVFGKTKTKGFDQVPCRLDDVVKIELYPLERHFNHRLGVRLKFRTQGEESALDIVWKDPWTKSD